MAFKYDVVFFSFQICNTEYWRKKFSIFEVKQGLGLSISKHTYSIFEDFILMS